MHDILMPVTNAFWDCNHTHTQREEQNKHFSFPPRLRAVCVLLLAFDSASEFILFYLYV